MCPVENRRNSVIPSIIPRTIAWRKVHRLVFLIGVEEDGIDLDAKPDEDKSWSQTDAAPAVDVWVEYVGIVTAPAYHKDETQGDNGCPMSMKR